MLHRVSGIVVACLLSTTIALAGDKRADDVKNLQGTWQAVYLEANGKKSPDDQVKELQIVVRGDQLFAVRPEGEGKKVKFTLDAGRTPQTIDLSPIDGSDKAKIAAGIYSLKHGQLKLCINLFGKDTTQRPTAFKTHEGDGVGFAILERAKAPLPAR
jgi:uncharacterized protein (TIGR03067 family)